VLFNAMRPDAGHRVHSGTDDRWATWAEIKDHPNLRERYDAGVKAVAEALSADTQPKAEGVREAVALIVQKAIGRFALGDLSGDVVNDAASAILSLPALRGVSDGE
jgi:hypothetical protein